MNPLEYPLDELLWIHRLSMGEGVEVHGCGVIAPDGRGLLLTGHSGAGKSTSSRLWSQHDGARVLSDDRIILRREQRPHMDVRNSLARRRGNRRSRSRAAGWNLCVWRTATGTKLGRSAVPRLRGTFRAQFRAASLDRCDHFHSGIFQQSYRLRPLLRIFICAGFYRCGGLAP